MISKPEYLKLRAVEILNDRIERKITALGERLPDMMLSNFEGEKVPVSSLYQEKPLLLGFMRASWCPYCRAQVTMLDGMADAFKGLGCEIVVISRETAEESTFTTDKFTLVSDLTNEFGRKLGMTYFATEEITAIYRELGIDEEVEGYWDTSELNVPATYIIDTDGRILFKHAKRDYTQRATGSEIIRELSLLNQRALRFE